MNSLNLVYTYVYNYIIIIIDLQYKFVSFTLVS